MLAIHPEFPAHSEIGMRRRRRRRRRSRNLYDLYIYHSRKARKGRKFHQWPVSAEETVKLTGIRNNESSALPVKQCRHPQPSTRRSYP
jgi:hypothetical protein